MRKILCTLGMALGLSLLAGAPVSAETEPEPQTLTKPCSGNDVDCPEGPDVPDGSPCSIDANGDGTPDFTGTTKTDRRGNVVCNCLVPVPTTTTSTTVPETTTTTEAPTTTSTTVGQPTTTVSPTTEEPPTTVAQPRPSDTIRTEFVARPAGARELPRTGSNGTLLTAAVGVGLVTLGVVLVLVTRRRGLHFSR